MPTRRSSVSACWGEFGWDCSGFCAAIRSRAGLGTIRFPKLGAKKRHVRRKPGPRQSQAIPQRFPMRCTLERPRTKGQVHSGTAHSGGVAALHGGDSGMGKVFWAKAADSTAANEPAGANLPRHTWLRQCGPANSGCFAEATSFDRSRNRRVNSGECSAARRFAGTHHHHRKQPLPRGVFKPGRCRQKLEAQKIYG